MLFKLIHQSEARIFLPKLASVGWAKMGASGIQTCVEKSQMPFATEHAIRSFGNEGNLFDSKL